MGADSYRIETIKVKSEKSLKWEMQSDTNKPTLTEMWFYCQVVKSAYNIKWYNYKFYIKRSLKYYYFTKQGLGYDLEAVDGQSERLITSAAFVANKWQTKDHKQAMKEIMR